MGGLYIHIPFCVKKCAYCDFVSFPTDCHKDRESVNEYVNALIAEMKLLSARYPNFSADTVFLGGGTPSLLPLGAVSRIMEAAHKYFLISADAEATVECNVGTVDSDKLREYRLSGINRLSMGLQSASDRLLALMGRIHTARDFENCVQSVRDAGFTNINADIIYAYPTQTLREYELTAELCARLKLPHVSAYSLILEENTALYNAVSRGELTVQNEDDEFSMHSRGIELLTAAGYNRYEISNYALSGYECRHNLNYWDCGEYLGMGINAHSAIRDNGWTRHSNYPDMERYLRSIGQGRLPVESENTIGKSEEMLEYIMLGLRKVNGFCKSDFEGRFGVSFEEKCRRGIAVLTRDKLLVCDEQRVYLTSRGLDLQNHCVTELI